MKFEVKQDAGQMWRWRLYSAKDELLATSEPHQRRLTCVASLTAMIQSVSAERYELTMDDED